MAATALTAQKWNCAAQFATAAGPCVGPSFLRCGSCGAVNYCSQDHQMAHWNLHRLECNRMEQQMARASDLHDFPFCFIAEATQLMDEGRVTICSFLEKRDLHLKGLWQGECECADGNFTSCYPSEWHLPSSMCPCQGPSAVSEEPLTNWTMYYNWRKLPFNSPVAILLHWPLTLYHAIRLVTTSMSAGGLDYGSVVRIYYLGPEKELQILQIFAELIALLPGVHICIDMIGPEVPESRNGEVIHLDNLSKCFDTHCPCKGNSEKVAGSEMDQDFQFRGQVTIKLWRGLYHVRSVDLGSAPDIFVAPNAGIAAFSSWQPTIRLICDSKKPAIFSDYCEEAVDLAVNTMSLALTYPVHMNPFRQPLSPSDKILNLPTFSNCYIFGVN